MYTSIKNPISTCITVIGFKRPKLLSTTLFALQHNIGIEGTPLHIYIDGARESEPNEKQDVKATIKIAEEFEWCGEKKIFASKENKGLQHGVRYAIDTSLSEYESTIIVEDDIVTSPFFFDFMIQGLTYFKHNETIAAMCGHCYNYSRKQFNPTEPYFLKHFCCWGWATWRRAWDKVCWDTGVLRDELKRINGHREINFGIGEYVSGLLEAHHNGYINTWDVQTGVSFFLNDQMCLYPPETLSNNTGWRVGEHSTHTRTEYNHNAPMAYVKTTIDKSMKVKVSKKAWHTYSNFIYTPHTLHKVMRSKIVNTIVLIFPFLRPLKQRIKNHIKEKLAHRI